MPWTRPKGEILPDKIFEKLNKKIFGLAIASLCNQSQARICQTYVANLIMFCDLIPI